MSGSIRASVEEALPESMVISRPCGVPARTSVRQLAGWPWPSSGPESETRCSRHASGASGRMTHTLSPSTAGATDQAWPSERGGLAGPV
ncbi:hypothetical protein ACIRSS_21390 [Amycolatopsis sp. NPDC101161]|uniref:hypothetical protein n=1 Tax=Amycolatopsis sp. NPDC101161 TaxID=3363940 RepID=UPI00382B435D